MSEDIPLSVQIEQYLELIKHLKEKLQNFLYALNIYEHEHHNIESQKATRSYMNDETKILGYSKPLSNATNQVGTSLL